jgi:hypothetical protein
MVFGFFETVGEEKDNGDYYHPGGGRGGDGD